MKPILACMLSVSGLTLTEDEKKLLSKANPLGITLFKRNILDEMKQVVATCSELTDVAYERFSKIKQLINRPISNFDVKFAQQRYSELSSLSSNLNSDYDAVEILHQMNKKGYSF